MQAVLPLRLPSMLSSDNEQAGKSPAPEPSNHLRLGMIAAALCATLAGGCAAPNAARGTDATKAQVAAAERAFASAMAQRDFEAFSALIADEAVFFSGPMPLRGKAQVTAWWARYFKDATAPFSWEPDEVEVLDSGTLALSSGPVRDGNGKVIARFTSIWRQDSPGTWRIVFDKGSPVALPRGSVQ
jgi:ketosteroid isomerase-like protein